MVAMPIAKRLPVGWTNLPSPTGIGLVNVPVITPVTAVPLPDPKRTGWTSMLMSGAKTNSAFRSSMWRSSPWVSWPSGQVTTMSLAWLSCRRSHFWFEKTSKSSVSNTSRFRSTAGLEVPGLATRHVGFDLRALRMEQLEHENRELQRKTDELRARNDELVAREGALIQALQRNRCRRPRFPPVGPTPRFADYPGTGGERSAVIGIILSGESGRPQCLSPSGS
jgi:hypothetical protein